MEMSDLPFVHIRNSSRDLMIMTKQKVELLVRTVSHEEVDAFMEIYFDETDLGSVALSCHLFLIFYVTKMSYFYFWSEHVDAA